MAIYKPSELKAFLRELGVVPKKELSQNFLIDGNILDKIVLLAAVKPTDRVVEIGSGPGALTEKLLATGCELIAIEKDRQLAEALKRFQRDRFASYTADALDFPYEQRLKGKRVKVVANLPYNVTTALLEKFAPLAHLIECAVFMVQEEAGRRFTGKTNPEEFSTLFVRYYTTPHYGFHVPASCFYPAPKVGSCVIRLDFQKRFPVANETVFLEMAKTAFSQKRKTIKASLSHLFVPEIIEQALITIHKSPMARPEELSLEEWTLLYTSLSNSQPL